MEIDTADGELIGLFLRLGGPDRTARRARPRNGSGRRAASSTSSILLPLPPPAAGPGGPGGARRRRARRRRRGAQRRAADRPATTGSPGRGRAREACRWRPAATRTSRRRSASCVVAVRPGPLDRARSSSGSATACSSIAGAARSAQLAAKARHELLGQVPALLRGERKRRDVEPSLGASPSRARAASSSAPRRPASPPPEAPRPPRRSRRCGRAGRACPRAASRS